MKLKTINKKKKVNFVMVIGKCVCVCVCVCVYVCVRVSEFLDDFVCERESYRKINKSKSNSLVHSLI